jgi:hypothetical protein
MNCTELAGKFSRNGRLSSTWQAAKDDEHSKHPLYSWLHQRVAEAFDLAGITNTVGARKDR